jgi:hypothetical protein
MLQKKYSIKMRKKNSYKQPWLYNSFVEFIFILLPPFICLLLIVLLPQYFSSNATISNYSWIILVLLIDVAHVYSTLYRTYFDKEMLQNDKTVLYAIPLVAFLCSVVLYNLSSFWFWRIMAYTAVFHFIRQQYGFMRLYSTKDTNNKSQIWLDKFVIYYATIYPIIYWHCSTNRRFDWFVDGDFLLYKNATIVFISTVVYYAMIILFVVNTLYITVVKKVINIPKLLVIIGTLLSWYFGIIYFNGDMTFTLLNIVSHGIPYMALVWIYSYKKYQSKPNYSTSINKKIFSKYGVLLFIAIIFLLAYVEEGLWNGLVWKENKRIFHLFAQPFINPSHQMLSFIVPILALPQITHYIIDGFIWRIKKIT